MVGEDSLVRYALYFQEIYRQTQVVMGSWERLQFLSLDPPPGDP